MHRIVIVVVVLTVLTAVPAGMAAQSPSSGFPTTPTYFEVPREILGDWDEGSFGGGNCGSLKDERGNPRGTCQLPVDKLEPLLNQRARAWIAFFDEPLSPRWTCTAANVVTALGEAYMFNFSLTSEAVLQKFEQSNWVRYIWVDGRPHPRAEERFYQGHSIGRMEGDTFVVESTNFTFDPDGFDDQAHIATSHMKKVTERYRAMGKDTMEVTITIDDPIFLHAPFTWSFPVKRPTREWTNEWQCDPEVGLHHLYNSAFQKYKDDKMFEKYADK
jgi:hypothetical protein